VTAYVEPPTVLATLAAIAPFAAGGGWVVFDYSVPAESLSPRPRAALEAMATRAAAAGEPFRGFFEPAALSAAMRALGFHEIRDLGADQLNMRFFPERADGLRVGSAGRIMSARGRGREGPPGCRRDDGSDR
jgi:O-methyltransferase involved in polyketide biosynthesis